MSQYWETPDIQYICAIANLCRSAETKCCVWPIFCCVWPTQIRCRSDERKSVSVGQVGVGQVRVGHLRPIRCKINAYKCRLFYQRLNASCFFRLNRRVFTASITGDWQTTNWIWRQHVDVNYSHLPLARPTNTGPFKAHRTPSHKTISGLFCGAFGSNNCVSVAIKSEDVEELNRKWQLPSECLWSVTTDHCFSEPRHRMTVTMIIMRIILAMMMMVFMMIGWHRLLLAPIVWVKKSPPPEIFWHLPKRFGIFSPNFMCLFYIPIYTRLPIFIQLPATLSKLSHIKSDHHLNLLSRMSWCHDVMMSLQAYDWYGQRRRCEPQLFLKMPTIGRNACCRVVALNMT